MQSMMLIAKIIHRNVMDLYHDHHPHHHLQQKKIIDHEIFTCKPKDRRRRDGWAQLKEGSFKDLDTFYLLNEILPGKY